MHVQLASSHTSQQNHMQVFNYAMLKLVHLLNKRFKITVHLVMSIYGNFQPHSWQQAS